MNARDLFTHYDLDRRVVIDSDSARRPPDQPVTAFTPTVPDRRPEQYDYPQVIVVQGREHPSWLREHAGHLIAAAGVGVFGLAVLSVVAIIAIALALAAMTGAVSVVAMKAMSTSSQPTRRGRRTR
jgi:hypothetical protein